MSHALTRQLKLWEGLPMSSRWLDPICVLRLTSMGYGTCRSHVARLMRAAVGGKYCNFLLKVSRALGHPPR
eukprot:4995325-Ditylum_brightwellii.AAC.1